jgi:outer membrane biosynthesis protein TonB
MKSYLYDMQGVKDKMSRKTRTLLLLTALLTVFCLVLAACGSGDKEDSANDESITSVEQTEESQDRSKEDAASEEDATAGEEIAEEDAEQKAEEEQASKEAEKKVAKEKTSKETKKDKTSKKKKEESKSSKSSSSESKPKEKKKVWVEPVTETRTVTLDTGTRYCCGAKSGGGCGASWHGSKDSTYNSWHKHWQDYVKKRTEEEEAKGKVYVCDHIHDDSKWVPDTTTEEVVVKEGYWKEVD